MKTKKILTITAFLFLLLNSSKFYSQTDVTQKAKEGAQFICDCTKKSLVKNGIDTAKLTEIFNSYNSKGTLLNKYNADVKKINNQMKQKYSLVETDIYDCRNQFRQKFSSYLKNRLFLEKMQTILDNNPFTSGPKLIKDLAANL
jgi:hypothetical protein